MSAGRLLDGWTRPRFGDIAASITERVDDPSVAGVDRYVGLEHLDPESTTIRRWGSPSDVASTKLRFYPGDVIYGRRRAYQRKLGVADFEGICSAHALVLRAKPGVCLPEFLPYFLQSDAFHQRALDISVGSLSPTINWKTLAVQEFAIPPIAEQQRIASVLTAASRVSTALTRASDETSRLRGALIATTTTERDVPLGELLASCEYGLSVQPMVAGSVPILRMNNIFEGELDLTDLRWVERCDAPASMLLESGDILFNRTNSVEHVGKVALVESLTQDSTFASYLLRLRVDPAVAIPGYICAFLQSAVGRSRIEAYVTRGVSQANVNATNLQKVLVPALGLKSQAAVAERWRAVRALAADVAKKRSLTASLMSELRETLLGGLDVQ